MDIGWQRDCETCDLRIASDVVRGGRLVEDLISWSQDSTFKLANTYVDSQGEIYQQDPADAFLCPILEHSHDREYKRRESKGKSRWDRGIKAEAENVKFSAKKLVAEMREWSLGESAPSKTSNGQGSVDRKCRALFGSYIEGDLITGASLDLVSAVLRQGSFIAEMNNLGWSDPKRLEEGLDDGNVARGIVR